MEVTFFYTECLFERVKEKIMAEIKLKELKINPAWCKGCGICVAFCPKSALELVNGKVQLKIDNHCILCGNCELRCPDYAIYIEEKEGETGQWVK